MIIVQKPFLSQIDTHTWLFFIIKETERNDEKDFVIYAESKRSKYWSNFENIWFKIYHNILQINERNNQLWYFDIVASNDTLTNTVNKLKFAVTFLLNCTI